MRDATPESDMALSRAQVGGFPSHQRTALAVHGLHRSASINMLASLRARLAPSTTAFAAAAGALAAHGLIQRHLQAEAEARSEGALNPNEWKPFKLIEKEQLTGNTYRFRFALPPDQVSGLTVASCLVTKALVQGKGEEGPQVVVRPYTPTSTPEAKGYLELVVKIYPDGKLTPVIGSLKVGDTLDFKGPIPKYPYTANTKKAIGMVAGGTGITPMLQVIDAVLSNPEDKTQVSLVYASVSEEDIILRDKIDALAAAHPNFTVYYVVDKPSWGGVLWKGGVGFVTADMLKSHLPAPSADSLVMVCGPPGLMRSVSGDKAPDKSQGELSGLLKELGYNSSQVYKF